MFQTVAKNTVICVALAGTLSSCAIKGANSRMGADHPAVQQNCWTQLKKADEAVNQFQQFPQKARGNLMVLRMAFSPQHNGKCMQIPGYAQASQQMLARAEWVVNSVAPRY